MSTIVTEEKKGWWRDLFGSRKPQSWLVAAVLVSAGGLLLMSLGGIDSSGQKRLDQPETIFPEAVSQQPQVTGMERDERFLEAKLERILGQIDGVGSVSATVTLAAGPQYDYAVNVTTSERSVDENDRSGGTRSTTEQNRDGQLVLLKTEQNGVEQPVVVRESSPEVRGVLVVAEGARDIRVQARIVQAVQTIFDIPVHKVNVFEKGR
ncbi:MAG: hypothetical protein ACYC2T_00145 [Bacillota bacterium]